MVNNAGGRLWHILIVGTVEVQCGDNDGGCDVMIYWTMELYDIDMAAEWIVCVYIMVSDRDNNVGCGGGIWNDCSCHGGWLWRYW